MSVNALTCTGCEAWLTGRGFRRKQAVYKDVVVPCTICGMVNRFALVDSRAVAHWVVRRADEE
jgi:RNase P subunit RPR2